MKLLLLGANGQVGWELQRALAPLGTLEICDRRQADLSRPDAVAALVQRCRPDIIVNAAAYTAVDKAESDQALAHMVNATAVGMLAEQARSLGALLVHYSTDYVFDGSQPGPQAEDVPTRPLNVYGATKLEGEQLIRASRCRHLILRTSWVYAARGQNFAKTMLRLASERDELKVVSDQFGAPTSAELIADVTALVIQQMQHDPERALKAGGTYHLAASGHTNWFEYARFVISTAATLGMQFKVNDASILPISAAEFPAPAARPANSRLDTRKLQHAFDLRLPHWQYHTARMLQEIVPVELAARTASQHLSDALKQAEHLSHAALSHNNVKGIS
ncbi:dTDP-4-dehydrorhamnose reductase [Stutzerimonas nitrititolerans]|uniref:dTDP-4-dehydrorhamnose reductase n=1 Tax=Stutzerimonas nitrititolerans TaxID=2482751 RepID=UPI00289F0854|nr:dTDP-4-dehydrorhamnose reductase [Stutzerimonas nitrititolerans]